MYNCELTLNVIVATAVQKADPELAGSQPYQSITYMTAELC